MNSEIGTISHVYNYCIFWYLRNSTNDKNNPVLDRAIFINKEDALIYAQEQRKDFYFNNATDEKLIFQIVEIEQYQN
jgi:hypothetical protein